MLMKVIPAIKYMAAAAALLGCVALASHYLSAPDSDGGAMRKATVEDVRAMARLVSMDIYEDIPLRDSIGPRHIFAVVRVRGSVGFDLDSIRADFSGDTVVVRLPPDVVTLDESMGPGSYEVIDTWNDRLLASSRITAAEESAMKRRMSERAVRRLHADGTVDRARQDAAASLGRMLEAAWRVPVRVE